MFEAPPLHKLQKAIASPSNPIGMRMRAAYYLRQAYDNYKRNESEEDDTAHDATEVKESKESDTSDHDQNPAIDEIVIQTLCQGLVDERHGSLLRHEFAYVMGQIRDERVSPKASQTSSFNL